MRVSVLGGLLMAACTGDTGIVDPGCPDGYVSDGAGGCDLATPPVPDLELEVVNLSGERLVQVYAYDVSANTLTELLGSAAIDDGDSLTLDGLDDGVWSFYALSSDKDCAAVENAELSDDSPSYYWKILRLEYDCSDW